MPPFSVGARTATVTGVPASLRIRWTTTDGAITSVFVPGISRDTGAGALDGLVFFLTGIEISLRARTGCCAAAGAPITATAVTTDIHW